MITIILFSLLQNPNDISYVFSGFAPLSIRLAQLLARPGWRSIDEVLAMLPGQRFHRVQQIPDGLRKRRESMGVGRGEHRDNNFISNRTIVDCINWNSWGPEKMFELHGVSS